MYVCMYGITCAVRSAPRQIHGHLFVVPRRCGAKGCERGHHQNQDKATDSVRRLVSDWIQGSRDLLRYYLPIWLCLSYYIGKNLLTYPFVSDIKTHKYLWT